MMKINDTISINGYEHILFQQHEVVAEEEMLARSKSYYQWLDKRRSVRELSDQAVPKSIIEHLILSASTAPSGAHKQPWTFVAVSDPSLKSKIREAAEIEEKEGYDHRMSERWKKDLEHLGTDKHKPFLESAPWLIIAFKKVYEFDEDGTKHNNYYVNESVGIACGLLIAAIHNAGLVTLTHTPSPMNFLAKILNRPSNERAYIFISCGLCQRSCLCPQFEKKKTGRCSCVF